MSEQKKAKSPYQKYGKKEFRYSELYYRWKDAVKNGRKNEADRLSIQHSCRFLGITEAQLQRHRDGRTPSS